VWLQQRYLSPGAVHWYDAAATLVYVTHFLATPVMAAVLWLRNRKLWLGFVRRVLALAVAGLLTYIVFPAAPPWYASRTGDIGPVVRASGRGWFWLHINHAGNLLQEGQAASNPVAAMPSLHTGYATIIALFVLSTVASRFAWLMLLYPALMAVSLVYLGEHYVVDVVAGIVYALVIHTAVNGWESWHETRQKVRATGSGGRPTPAD
jgi:membrane-associated phospholipid phosphatase